MPWDPLIFPYLPKEYYNLSAKYYKLTLKWAYCQYFFVSLSSGLTKSYYIPNSETYNYRFFETDWSCCDS